MTRSTILPALLTAVSLSACGSPQPNTSAQPAPQAPPAAVSPPTAPPPKPVAAANLDTLAEPVSDCRPETVLPLITDITRSGSADAVAVCRQMTLVFGSPPQVRVLRSMTATLTAFADGDPRDEPRSLAGLLVFAHLRGADTPEALLSTLRAARNMRAASQERLTLRELLGFMRSAGPLARSMSDEGLVAMAPTIVALDGE